MIGGAEWRTTYIRLKKQSVKAPVVMPMRQSRTSRRGIAHSFQRHSSQKDENSSKHLICLPKNKIPNAQIQKLLAQGITIWSLPYWDDESNSKKSDAAMVDNNKDFVPFTYGYNSPRFAENVQNILLIASAIRQQDPKSKISLWADQGAGHVAHAAFAIAGDKIEKAVLVTDGFRFGDVNSITSSDFVPGAVKYGDMPALLALAAPKPILIIDSKIEEETLTVISSLDLLQKCYRANDAEPGRLQFLDLKDEMQKNPSKGHELVDL